MPKLTPEEFLATVLVAEKFSEHICWKCKHLKPVLKDSGFPPADTIGWCMKIHWPFYWCVTEGNVVRKCYAFAVKEARVAAGGDSAAAGASR